MDIKKILDIIKDGEEEIYSPENAVYFEDDTITKEEFDEGDETNEEQRISGQCGKDFCRLSEGRPAEVVKGLVLRTVAL